MVDYYVIVGRGTRPVVARAMGDCMSGQRMRMDAARKGKAKLAENGEREDGRR